MSTESDGRVTVYVAPCPTCGLDAPWHAKQFSEPTPKCRRCSLRSPGADAPTPMKKSKQIKP